MILDEMEREEEMREERYTQNIWRGGERHGLMNHTFGWIGRRELAIVVRGGG